jgi:hypothetical protein
MRRKFIKYSLSIALLLTLFAGCVSIRKEGKSFILELKTMPPAAAPGHAPTTIPLYDMSSGQARPLNSPLSQFKSRTTISWTASTTNEDSTPLIDLEKYTIYYARTEKSLGTRDRMRILVPKKTTSIVIYNLASGEWCFQVTAYDTSFNESGFSNGACEHIP